MGRKVEKKLEGEARQKKRDKKKREVAGPKPGIVDVLHCPPIGRFHYELVVGNGIGDYAVEDALEAFKRAWETRRQKAHDAANQDVERPSKDCEVAEHLVVGPFSSPQDWKIDTDAEPMTAVTWCWVGYESVRFCKPA